MNNILKLLLITGFVFLLTAINTSNVFADKSVLLVKNKESTHILNNLRGTEWQGMLGERPANLSFTKKFKDKSLKKIDILTKIPSEKYSMTGLADYIRVGDRIESDLTIENADGSISGKLVLKYVEKDKKKMLKGFWGKREACFNLRVILPENALSWTFGNIGDDCYWFLL